MQGLSIEDAFEKIGEAPEAFRKTLTTAFSDKDFAKNIIHPTIIDNLAKDVEKSSNEAAETVIKNNQKIQNANLNLKSSFKEIGAAIANAFMSAAISWAISALIEGISSIVTAEERIGEKAKRIGQEFNDSVKDIENYKKQIVDLKSKIDDSNTSYEETVKYRESLYEIQDELIKKYGLEKGAIETVTTAIDGQVDALDRLTESEWNRKRNEFNEADLGENWSNIASGYLSNYDRMMNEMTNYSISFHLDFEDQDFINKLKELELIAEEDLFNVSGNYLGHIDNTPLEEVYDKLVKIRDLELKNDTNLWYIDQLDKALSDVSKKLERYTDLYYQGIKYDKILKNLDYSEAIDKLNEARQNLRETSDNEEKSKLKKELLELYQNTYNSIDDSAVKLWLEHEYAEIKTEVEKWDFKIKFSADTSGFKDKVKSFQKLTGISSEEFIQYDKVYSGYSDKDFDDTIRNTTDFKQKAKIELYRQLSKAAQDYGISLKTLLEILEEEGIIFSKTEQEIRNVLGNDTYERLTDDQKESLLGFTEEDVENLSKRIDGQKEEAINKIREANAAIEEEKQKLSDWGLGEYAGAIIGNTMQHKFGNVDMDKRAIIEWSDELKQTFQDELASWDYDPEIGGIDTVFGGFENFDVNGVNIPISFSPIMVDENGVNPQLLTSETVYNYINRIIQQAISNLQASGLELSNENIFAEIIRLDEEGIDTEEISSAGEYIGKTFVHGIVSGVDDYTGQGGAKIGASIVSMLTHFVGAFGAFGIASKEAADANDELNNSVLNTVDAFIKEKTSIEQGTKTRREMIDSINKMNSGFDVLKDLYQDIQNGGDFDFAKLDTDNFKNAFEGLEGEYQDFIETISKSPNDIQACQEAFNELTTSFINHSKILEDLNEENAEVAKSMLEMMGVENAAEVIDRKLAVEKEKLKFATEDLTAETWEEALAELQLAGDSDIARAALAQLELAKLAVNNTKIDTADDIRSIIALANAAGESAAKIANLKAAAANMESADLSSGNLGDLRKFERSEQTARDYLNNLNFEKLDPADFIYHPSGTSGGGGGGGGGGSSSSEPTEVDGFTQALENLETEIGKVQEAESNAFDTYDERSDALEKRMDLLNQKLEITQEAYASYMAEAEKYLTQLPQDLQSLAQSGNRNAVNTIPEQYKEVYEKAVEWINKANDMLDKTEDVHSSLEQGALDRLDLLKQRYQDQFDELEYQIDKIEAQASISEYETGQKNLDLLKQKEALHKQIAELYMQETSEIDAQLQKEKELGNIRSGTEAEAKYLDALRSAETSGLQAQVSAAQIAKEVADENAKTEEEFKKDLDWIERLLNRLSKITDKWKKQAERFFTFWNKNFAVNKSIQGIQNQINAQNGAYRAYLKKANEVQLDSKYKKLVREGTIEIETIKDEGIANAIEEYQDWYDKAIDAQETIVDLYQEERDLIKQKLQNILDYYDTIDNYLSSITSRIESQISLKNAWGQRTSFSDLVTQYGSVMDQVDNAVEELFALQTGLAKEGHRTSEEIQADIDKRRRDMTSTESYFGMVDERDLLLDREAEYEQAKEDLDDYTRLRKEALTDKDKDLAASYAEDIKEAKARMKANKLTSTQKTILNRLLSQTEAFSSIFFDSDYYEKLSEQIDQFEERAADYQWYTDEINNLIEQKNAASTKAEKNELQKQINQLKKERGKAQTKNQKKLYEAQKKQMELMDELGEFGASQYYLKVVEERNKLLQKQQDFEDGLSKKDLTKAEKTKLNRLNAQLEAINQLQENSFVDAEVAATSQYMGLIRRVGELMKKKTLSANDQKELQMKLEEINAINAGVAVEDLANYIKIYEQWWKLNDKGNLTGNNAVKFDTLTKQKEEIEKKFTDGTNALLEELSEALILEGESTADLTAGFRKQIEELKESYEKQIAEVEDSYKNNSAYVEFEKSLIKKRAERDKAVNTGKILSTSKQKTLDQYELMESIFAQGATYDNFSTYQSTVKNLVKNLQKYADKTGQTLQEVWNNLNSGNLTIGNLASELYKSAKDQNNLSDNYFKIINWDKEKAESISIIQKEMNDAIRQVQMEMEQTESEQIEKINEKKQQIADLAKQIAEYEITGAQNVIDTLSALIEQYKGIANVLENTNFEALKKYGVADILGIDDTKSAIELLKEQLTGAISATMDKLPKLVNQSNLYQELIDAGEEASFDGIFEKYLEDADDETRALIESVKQALNENEWDENTWIDEWRTKQGEVTNAILESIQSIQDLKDELRENVVFKAAREAIKQAESLSTRLSAISGIIKDEWVFDNESGNFTGMGLTKINLLTQELEQARTRAKSYSDMIKEIDDAWQNEMTAYDSEEEYLEAKNQAVADYYSSLQDAYNIADSIVQLGKQAAEKELDTIRKTVDAYKTALNSKKAYYEYSKNIQSKTKEIEALEAQIRALNGVETAEAKARMAMLEEQKKTAEESLEDLKQEHLFELETNRLDKFIEDLEELLSDENKSLQMLFEDWSNRLEELMTLGSGADVEKYLQQIIDTVMGKGYSLVTGYNDTIGESSNKAISSISNVAASAISQVADEAVQTRSQLSAEYSDTMADISAVAEDISNIRPLRDTEGYEEIANKYKELSVSDFLATISPALKNVTMDLAPYYNQLNNSINSAASILQNQLSDLIQNVTQKEQNVNVTLNYDSLLHVDGNVDKDALPDLKSILRQSADYTKSEIYSDLRRVGIMRTY